MSKLAVIRIRGTTGIRYDISKTLDLLNLKKLYNCVVLDDTPLNIGMIRDAQNYITWGEIEKGTFTKLVKSRGRIGSKKINDENAKELKFKDVEDLANSIYSGKAKLGVLTMPFKLSPPKKGFERKGIRFKYKEGGSLGYRGAGINKLLERMI